MKRMVEFHPDQSPVDPFRACGDGTDLPDRHGDLIADVQMTDQVGEPAAVFGKILDRDVEAYTDPFPVSSGSQKGMSRLAS